MKICRLQQYTCPKLDRSYPETDNGLSLLASDLSVEVDRGPQIILFSKYTVGSHLSVVSRLLPAYLVSYVILTHPTYHHSTDATRLQRAYCKAGQPLILIFFACWLPKANIFAVSADTHPLSDTCKADLESQPVAKIHDRDKLTIHFPNKA